MKKKLIQSSTLEDLLIPKLSRYQVQFMEEVETSTLIYVNDISNGEQRGTAIDIDSSGYYKFDGRIWKKLSGGKSLWDFYKKAVSRFKV